MSFGINLIIIAYIINTLRLHIGMKLPRIRVLIHFRNLVYSQLPSDNDEMQNLKWIVQVLVHYEIIVLTSPSITGVTYMDHFDFEERYRDANECNPLYWHPLHLPPYCAEVFEKLIRSRLAKNTPVRIKRKREKKKHHQPTYSYPEEFYNFAYPIYQIASAEYESYEYSPPINPYEEVMELLRRDIVKDPSSPTVTVIPELGPVALYKQGISRKSENKIKKMAEDYVKATKKMYEQYYAAYGKYPSEPEIYIYDSAKNKTKTEDNKKKKENQEEEKKNKVHRVRTKHGGVVTIIETKNLEMFKKEGPLL